MNWNSIKTTIKKELRAITRDKKSLRILIASPFIIPLLLLLMGLYYNTMTETTYKVGVDYTLTSEELAIVKETPNLEIVSYTTKEEMADSYENGNISSYISKSGKTYTIYYDNGSTNSQMASEFASTYLKQYNQIIANKYIIQNGLDLNRVYNNIEIKEEQLNDEGENFFINMLLGMLLPYVLMIALTGAATIATDSTAGEKERGTLETLLTFPVSSTEIITGKYLATTIVAFASGLFAFVLALVSMSMVPHLFSMFADVTPNFALGIIILAIFIILISSMLSAGLSIAISGTTKSFKEAQTALQPLSFFTMIPMFLSMFEVKGWVLSIIPLVNTGTLLNNIFFDNINYLELSLMFISTIIYIMIIILFISKQYKKESTLF